MRTRNLLAAMGWLAIIFSCLLIGQTLRNTGGGGSGGGSWGHIGGTLSDQTDLQAALDAKLGTGGNAATASALAANPTNCSAGQYPLGIAANGNVESCTGAASITKIDLSGVTSATLTHNFNSKATHTQCFNSSDVQVQVEIANGLNSNTATFPSSFTGYCNVSGGTASAVTVNNGPASVYFKAAGCDEVPVLGFEKTSNPPSPGCAVGSNNSTPYARFSATGQTVEGRFKLPQDWNSGADNNAYISFRSSATSGNAVWKLETACPAPTGASVDTAWNTAQTVSTAVQGTTLLTNLATISTVTTTNCAAGRTLQFRLTLDSSTTASGDHDLLDLAFQLRRW